ncbi:MAG TPA: ATP-binding protein [Anaerolineales bacterium]
MGVSKRKALEYAVPWLVLAVLLIYTYAKFFAHPYGVWWLNDGIVWKVFVNEREPTIHAGDRLLKVGSVDFQAFLGDLRRDLFEGIRPGESVPVTVQRGAEILTVQWTLPGPNRGEIRDQLFSEWFLAYFFWVAGAMTLLLLRPKDARWLLLAAFNFLTSIWLIAGSGLSSFHIWYSALVLRSVIWISVPVYLHLHWVFPKPLGKLPAPLLRGLYLVCGALAIAQWFQLLPGSMYFLGFLLAIAGSLILLIVHAVRQPDLRRDLGLLLGAAALAIIPSITLGIAGAVQGAPAPATTLALLSFPILPFAYLYAAFRSQLGGLEIRVNRLISIYIFVILLGAVFVPLLVVVYHLTARTSDVALITSIIVSIVVTAVALSGFPSFQSFVERRFLGIGVPSKELQQVYSARVTSSTSFTELTRLLDDEIVPSLLVREFVFLIFDNGSTRVLLRRGVLPEQVPVEQVHRVLVPLIGKNPARVADPDPNLGWIRLVLPLLVKDQLLGFWLFGRRDPDDLYSSVEVPILQLFANQASIALSNILQTERLRAMYEADIDRHENERLRLARDLHDSVLSELGGMLMNADMDKLPKNFQEGYQTLTQRLREIVSELRPPMLNYGLKPAIEELADNLMERGAEDLSIVVNLESSGDRYPPDKEQHLFRMVQEACENAVRHSHGRRITVSGRLAAEVQLSINDDGDGFNLAEQEIELYDLLSKRHFGLAGMFERAKLIDAEIRIYSAPAAGTRITIGWRPERLAAPDQGSGEPLT